MKNPPIDWRTICLRLAILLCIPLAFFTLWTMLALITNMVAGTTLLHMPGYETDATSSRGFGPGAHIVSLLALTALSAGPLFFISTFPRD